jgi:hypothetical protein
MFFYTSRKNKTRLFILHAAWLCARRADAGWRPAWITPGKPHAQPGVETVSRCLNCVAVQPPRSRDAMHHVSTPELRSACTGVSMSDAIRHPETRAKQCTKPSRMQYKSHTPVSGFFGTGSDSRFQNGRHISCRPLKSPSCPVLPSGGERFDRRAEKTSGSGERHLPVCRRLSIPVNDSGNQIYFLVSILIPYFYVQKH